jgi:hypothetical protein
MRKTQKRSGLVNDIIASLEKAPILLGIVKRNSSEGEFQKNLFLDLQKALPPMLSSYFGFSERKARKVTERNFKWEKKIDTPVPSFNFFATSHRPDAVLEIKKDLRIAVELKKGDSGESLRAGIGQALVYATQFDFTIYIFIDTTKGLDIKSSSQGEKEQALIDSLWKNYNVKFFVV